MTSQVDIVERLLSARTPGHEAMCVEAAYDIKALRKTLHLDRPHALSLRLTNSSDKSWLFKDLEDRRLAALRTTEPKHAGGEK